MAYTDEQRDIIAHGVAVVGRGRPSAAAEWLRANCIQVGDIGEATVRRFLKDEKFLAVLADHEKAIRAERVAASRDAERQRQRRELLGGLGDFVATMQEKVVEMFGRLETKLNTDDADPRELLRLWRETQAFLVSLQRQSGPVVAEIGQAELLIRAMREVAQTDLGPSAAQKLLAKIGKRFETLNLDEQRRAAETQADEPVAADAAPAAVPETDGKPLTDTAPDAAAPPPAEA